MRLSGRKEVTEFVEELFSVSPQMVSVGFLGDEWINSGAVWKKTKKKSTGQMNLVFDEESMALPVREAEDRGIGGRGAMTPPGYVFQDSKPSPSIMQPADKIPKVTNIAHES